MKKSIKLFIGILKHLPLELSAKIMGIVQKSSKKHIEVQEEKVISNQ